MKNYVLTKVLTCPYSYLDTYDSNLIYFYLFLQLKSRYNSTDETLFFNESYAKCNMPKIVAAKFKENVKILISEGNVKKYGNFNYIFDSNTCYLTGEQFLNIEIRDFIKIDKPDLLYHYMTILRSRNYGIEIMGERSKVSTMAINYFAKIEGVSEHTISRYNKALEDLDLLYVVHHSYHNGRENNIYARKCDAMYADSFTRVKYTENEESNFLRSVQQRIHHINVDTDMDQLIKDVIRYNAIMEKRGENRRIDLTELQ